MKPKSPRLRPQLLSCVLALLASACSTVQPQPTPPAVVECPKLPPLPQAARQPPTPPECSPTCADGLSKLLDSMLQSLTPAVAPAEPASGTVTK